MRKFLLALGLLLCAGAAQAQPVVPLTQASVPIDISSATTTQLVALDTTKFIVVTEFNFISAGTGNVQLVYGTGTACATGQGNLTGNYNLTAQTGIAVGDGTGVVLVVPKGNAVCIITSAAPEVSGSLAYAKF